MIPLCRDQGVGLIPWSPLARGFLAGNRTAAKDGESKRAKSDDYAHKMYYQETDFDVVERAKELGRRKGVSSAQISLAWLLHKPGVVSPIVGATKMRHLEEALGALEIALTEEEISYLEAPYQPHLVLGHQ